tara:strand:+ start:2840 stop:3145 length:306 start_codon:yes stop_codon:yes gene_type:complete
MNKFFQISIIILISFFLASCQTVSKKIDAKTSQEERKLTKWLNQPVEDLKIAFGKPTKIDFMENGNRNYIYIKEKIKIKCVRKFEINPKNLVVGFSSKNCF